MLHRYWFAAIAMVAALIRYALHPILGPGFTFIVSFPMLVFVGWYGGLGPGLLAAGFGLVGGGVLEQLHDERHAMIQVVSRFALFGFFGVLISLLCESLHRARRHAESSVRERLKAEENLERTSARLAEREQSLAEAQRIAHIESWELDLVEDHEDTSTIMAEFLESSGYQVKTADTVASALRIASTEPFDVVLSDLGLPDGSGYDLMQELATKHGLRGVALSGYGLDRDVEAAKAAGFGEHLTKPADPERLLEVLSRVVGEPSDRVSV